MVRRALVLLAASLLSSAQAGKFVECLKNYRVRRIEVPSNIYIFNIPGTVYTERISARTVFIINDSVSKIC